MEALATENKRNKLDLQFISGYPIIKSFPRKAIEQTLVFQPRSGDLLIAGYPKSGTTWLQYIVWDIVNHGAPLPTINDIWTKEFTHLEMVGTDGLLSLPSPRLMKVNLAFQYTPFCSLAKYIYITRNPFDVCVSYYDFMKNLEENYKDATFDEFFESFMRGEVSHGEYFSHISSWYNHRHDPNFFFLTYEKLQDNPIKYILEISKFLDNKFYKYLTENPPVLQRIFENTKFANMKQNCSLHWDLTEQGTFEPQSKEEQTLKNRLQFFRKGIVGDWKSYFSQEQRRLLQNKIKEKLDIEELISLWKNIGIL